MNNVVSFKVPRQVVAQTFSIIWEGDTDENGHSVAVAAEDHKDQPLSYVVLLTGQSGLEVIHRLPRTEEGLVAAKFAADIAEKTINAQFFLMPEDAA